MVMLTNEGKAIIEQLTKTIHKALETSLDKKGRNDTGALKDSIEVNYVDKGNELVIEGIFLKHGLYQEGGKKAGTFPNVGAIEQWVKRKLGIQDGALSVAWAIAKTHFEKGVHTRNGNLDVSQRGWMSEALTSVNAQIEKGIEDAFFVDMDIFINNLVDEFNKDNRA